MPRMAFKMTDALEVPMHHLGHNYKSSYQSPSLFIKRLLVDDSKLSSKEELACPRAHLYRLDIFGHIFNHDFSPKLSPLPDLIYADLHPS